MTTFTIIKKGNRYDIVKDGVQIVYGIRTGGFSTEKISFYFMDATEAGTYFEKRRFILKRSLYLMLPGSAERVEISSKFAAFFFTYNDRLYELRYGFFSFKGFFINDEKVGTLETLKSGVARYSKQINFDIDSEDLLFLIYCYIGEHEFGVN
ncbi:hypothetical protein [Ferruginibacter sp.]